MPNMVLISWPSGRVKKPYCVVSNYLFPLHSTTLYRGGVVAESDSLPLSGRPPGPVGCFLSMKASDFNTAITEH